MLTSQRIISKTSKATAIRAFAVRNFSARILKAENSTQANLTQRGGGLLKNFLKESENFIKSLQNFHNLKNSSHSKNSTNFKNSKNFELSANFKDFKNLEISKNFKDSKNFENSTNFKNLKNFKNSKSSALSNNFKNFKNFTNDENLENLENLEISQNLNFSKFSFLENSTFLFLKSYENENLLVLLVKTYEVNKCLYEAYGFIKSERSGEILSPDKNTSYKNALCYAIFALGLIKFYEKTKNYFYLNALLKLNDTLISVKNQLEFDPETKNFCQKTFSYSTQKECEFIKEILEDKFKNSLPKLKKISKNTQIFAPQKSFETMNLSMIYAITPRSFLYLNALLSEAKAPKEILIFINEKTKLNELQEHLKFLDKFKLKYKKIHSKSINDAACFEAIKNLKEKYILYSGQGILEPKYFSLGKIFLHIHAGSLPSFRGSTTCYYELLERSCISATCMFLAPGLDDGACVASFSLDKEEIKKLESYDIDGFIEPFVRAKCLLKSLKRLNSKDFSPQIQDESKQRTFYKIHPVLKHIAILHCFA